VRFANSWRAEDKEILSVFDKVAAGELVELLLVERRLVAEVASVSSVSRKSA
jgi:hypothetical protein